MAMPTDVPIIDCMISFPIEDKKKLYEFITKQTKDSQSKDEFEFPVEYMFKDVPDEHEDGDDPVAVTLREMDKHSIEQGLIGIGSGNSERALKEHPDRFVAAISVDPNDIMGVARAGSSRRTRSGTSAPSTCSRADCSRRSRINDRRCTRSTPSAWSSASRCSSTPASRARG